MRWAESRDFRFLWRSWRQLHAPAGINISVLQSFLKDFYRWVKNETTKSDALASTSSKVKSLMDLCVVRKSKENVLVWFCFAFIFCFTLELSWLSWRECRKWNKKISNGSPFAQTLGNKHKPGCSANVSLQITGFRLQPSEIECQKSCYLVSVKNMLLSRKS